MARLISSATVRFLKLLDLRLLERDLYRGEVEPDEGRLFGGLVLAQAVVAAGRTVEGRDIHSLHAYFLRAGKASQPVDYGVEEIREGRNFSTRRVTAMQGSAAIFEASIGFVAKEAGIAHQVPMPDAPDPESLPSWWDTIRSNEPRPARRRRRRWWDSPIDIRACEPQPKPVAESLPRRMVWARTDGPLPEDPLIHAAVMACMSDSGMVGTVGEAHRIWHNEGNLTASLDHAMWWHRPPRFDGWLLYVTESPVAHAARALTHGSIFTRDGALVASVAQEALFREGPASP